MIFLSYYKLKAFTLYWKKKLSLQWPLSSCFIDKEIWILLMMRATSNISYLYLYEENCQIPTLYTSFLDVHSLFTWLLLLSEDQWDLIKWIVKAIL